MSDQDDDPLFTLDEAASTLLRGLVKAATLRNAITRGELAHTRLGRRIVVTKRDIEEWRARCRVEANRTGSHRADSVPPRVDETDTSAALAAARASVARLRNGSPPKTPRSKKP